MFILFFPKVNKTKIGFKKELKQRKSLRQAQTDVLGCHPELVEGARRIIENILSHLFLSKYFSNQY